MIQVKYILIIQKKLESDKLKKIWIINYPYANLKKLDLRYNKLNTIYILNYLSFYKFFKSKFK